MYQLISILAQTHSLHLKKFILKLSFFWWNSIWLLIKMIMLPISLPFSLSIRILFRSFLCLIGLIQGPLGEEWVSDSLGWLSCGWQNGAILKNCDFGVAIPMEGRFFQPWVDLGSRYFSWSNVSKFPVGQRLGQRISSWVSSRNLSVLPFAGPFQDHQQRFHSQPICTCTCSRLWSTSMGFWSWWLSLFCWFPKHTRSFLEELNNPEL